MDEREARLKRLRMRSWRRGIKEMDLILGPFSDSELTGLSEPELELYEVLLAENDQDLYPWITARMKGESPGPQALVPLLDRIAGFAARRLGRKT
ncbi:succinate dehydrogenase assembly factor 2 [Paracoccus sp. (in: a-proteobacteria)]|uniref:FAD assembly factor SdhE n=1 Tax=Paracoccus sp. TaxID=267 RepID=UPI0039E34483